MTMEESLAEFQEGRKRKKERLQDRELEEEDLQKMLIKINEKTRKWEHRLSKLDTLRRKILAELRQFNSGS